MWENRVFGGIADGGAGGVRQEWELRMRGN